MNITVKTEFIKLDSFLKWAGAASLGSEAKAYILDGQVKVNGEVEVRRGKKIYPGDTVEFNGETYTAVKEEI
jgi:ribosome-associated protein